MAYGLNFVVLLYVLCIDIPTLVHLPPPLPYILSHCLYHRIE